MHNSGKRLGICSLLTGRNLEQGQFRVGEGVVNPEATEACVRARPV